MVAGVGLFVLYPVFCLIRASLLVDDSLSLARYQTLIRDYWTLLKNSVFSSALAAVLSTAVAVAVTLRVCSAGPKLRGLLMTVLLISMVSPPFVHSLAYIQLYGRRGWITYSLLHLSLNPYNWRGVVIMQTLTFSSLNALFLVGMLDKADRRLVHAARDLGASSARALWSVLLPLVRPGILASLLLSFIRALADFGTPIVIGGRFNTLAAEIYMQITGYANLPLAATLNMLIFLPSAALFLVYRRLMKHSDRLLTGAGGVADTASPLEVRGIPSLAVGAVCYLFFTALILQYGCIFLGGFVKAVRGRYTFTLEHLERVLTYDVDSLGRSVVYALIVGFAGTLFAMFFAYYVERRKIPGGNLLDFLITMPYMIPGTCFGIGYILAFNREPLKLTGTAAIVVLNMLFRQLPNTTKICSAALAQIPYSLEDASRDLGASRFRVILDVILPGLGGAFFSSFAYNFTSAMTTAGSILFLIQPSKKIAVFRLFDAISTGHYGVASLIATVLILVSLLVNLVILGLTRKSHKGGGHIVLAADRAL